MFRVSTEDNSGWIVNEARAVVAALSLRTGWPLARTIIWWALLEYDAFGHHRVPGCDKNLPVMMTSYQEEYFEKREWELETRRTVQVRCDILHGITLGSCKGYREDK